MKLTEKAAQEIKKILETQDMPLEETYVESGD